MIPVNNFGKINQPPLKYLPCVVLSKPSVGKTCFIESGSTSKAPNLSCLAASESQNIAYDNTLIEPHHEIKNNTATPR